jgi:hypothetical protein
MTRTEKRHLVIAGPGRAGTTLLVRLFDELGFETHAQRLEYFEEAYAGLEADILASDAPYVIKKPNLTWHLRELLETGQLARESIDWLVVPLRDLDDAAASRIRVTAARGKVSTEGGLVRTRQPGKQRQALAEITYSLFQTAAAFELPLIVLEYPAFARDAEYAYRRLAPVLGLRTQADFDRAWHAVVEPRLVRSEPIPVSRATLMHITLLRMRERLRGTLGDLLVKTRMIHLIRRGSRDE